MEFSLPAVSTQPGSKSGGGQASEEGNLCYCLGLPGCQPGSETDQLLEGNLPVILGL